MRQNEMNVNITLVTTSTWPAVGPFLLGAGDVATAAAAGSGGLDENESAAINNAVREGRSAKAGQVGDYNGVTARSSRGDGASRRERLPAHGPGARGRRPNRRPR